MSDINKQLKEFEKEDRYLVIKRSDLREALILSKPEVEQNLNALCDSVDLVRRARGKAALCAVVVESDWPEYEIVWEMIKERCEPEQGFTVATRKEPSTADTIEWVKENEHDALFCDGSINPFNDSAVIVSDLLAHLQHKEQS